MKKKLLLIVFITIGNLQASLSQVISDDHLSTNPQDKKVFEIDLFTPPNKLWVNYDFIPGKNILFFDSFLNEKEGGKPSRWKTITGNATINNFQDENVITFETAKKTAIEPIFLSKEGIPRNFTLEFDIYFDKYANQSITEYWLYFNDNIDNRIEFTSYSPLNVKLNSKNLPSISKSLEYSSMDNFSGWHHISLSYHFNTLKLYFDGLLIANEYASSLHPENIAIYGNTYDYRENSNRKTLLKNFKLSTGRSSIYSEIASRSKYSTSAIIFEYGKPFFNSPSSGELKKLYNFLHENPNWNFRITAPNDNTIDEKYNFEISTKRSQCIKDALIQLGINERRLSIVSEREAKNMDYYATVESKKENQKVEFILRP